MVLMLVYLITDDIINNLLLRNVMLYNSTWLITALHIAGVVAIIFGVFTFLSGGVNGVIIFVASIGVAIPFFFFAQILQNIIRQTVVLEDISEDVHNFIEENKIRAIKNNGISKEEK
jgi:hypothetical protein